MSIWISVILNTHEKIELALHFSSKIFYCSLPIASTTWPWSHKGERQGFERPVLTKKCVRRQVQQEIALQVLLQSTGDQKSVQIRLCVVQCQALNVTALNCLFCPCFPTYHRYLTTFLIFLKTLLLYAQEKQILLILRLCFNYISGLFFQEWNKFTFKSIKIGRCARSSTYMHTFYGVILTSSKFFMFHFLACQLHVQET